MLGMYSFASSASHKCIYKRESMYALHAYDDVAARSLRFYIYGPGFVANIDRCEQKKSATAVAERNCVALIRALEVYVLHGLCGDAYRSALMNIESIMNLGMPFSQRDDILRI
jgi:hypothetical protein